MYQFYLRTHQEKDFTQSVSIERLHCSLKDINPPVLALEAGCCYYVAPKNNLGSCAMGLELDENDKVKQRVFISIPRKLEFDKYSNKLSNRVDYI